MAPTIYYMEAASSSAFISYMSTWLNADFHKVFKSLVNKVIAVKKANMYLS